MFERFTDEARRVVVVAQEEAREAHSPEIGPQHLLLALGVVAGPGSDALRASGTELGRLRDAVLAVADDALDDCALAAVGIDLSAVREKVEAAFGAGALSARRHRRRKDGHLPFAGESKRALEQALRAALRLGDRSLDSRHLLLGLLAVGDSRVTDVLRRVDVEPEDLRRLAEARPDAA